MTDPYEILGLSRAATPADIKRAYRSLAKDHHPDAGGDAQRFAAIAAAFAILGDPEKRRTYDATGVIDDAVEETADADAITLLDRLLTSVIARTGDQWFEPDIIAAMRKAIDDTTRQTEKQVAEVTFQRRRVQRLKDKLQRKAGSNAILESMMERQIRDMGTSIESGNAHIVLLARTKELLEAYSWKSDTESPMRQEGFTLSFGGHGQSPFSGSSIT